MGPYVGETLGRARSIVHFDPLVAATRNRPTAIAITGEPGGGKTTLALLMIYQMALRGVTVAVIDPKGDADSLVQLLRKRGRKARIIPLGSAAPGLLDPFSFGDDLAAKKTMATETLRLLLPRMSEERESAMIQAVAAVSNAEDPSLGKVVDYLERTEDAASKNLGAVLRSMSDMHLARLCFDPSGGDQIDTEGWTTVFTLGGLTLPDASTGRDDYSYEQRLSVALLYLVAQFARGLMNGLDRRTPKAIFLDEAWAITSTPEGAKLVPEVSRMGPLPQHRAGPGLAERRRPAERAGDQLPVVGLRVPFHRTGRGGARDGAARGRAVGGAQGGAALARQRRMRLPGSGRSRGPYRGGPDLR
ncbi:hypothetical protein GCM10018952_03710 [Streptosporangium vulgare]